MYITNAGTPVGDNLVIQDNFIIPAGSCGCTRAYNGQTDSVDEVRKFLIILMKNYTFIYQFFLNFNFQGEQLTIANVAVEPADVWEEIATHPLKIQFDMLETTVFETPKPVRTTDTAILFDNAGEEGIVKNFILNSIFHSFEI